MPPFKLPYRTSPAAFLVVGNTFEKLQLRDFLDVNHLQGLPYLQHTNLFFTGSVRPHM
ncbi:hypothetical protein M3J09_008367 [Ascochyta lentis]